MKPTQKLRSTRGTTIAEVLLVVALVVILLGVAVPDIISYSKMIKLTAMNDNARAVAVAVQSKLYAMQNSGTSGGSEYAMLNGGADKKEITVTVGEETETKTVRYVCNWDVFNEDTDEGAKKNDNMLLAKQMLLSGAITDVELLKKGYIMVVYDPSTADVLYVYYSDKPFDVAQVFSAGSETYLQDNFIGKYIGEGSPVPSYKATLPRFSAEWVFDDEMYLQLTMVDIPADSLLDKPLGLEVFAVIPGGDKVLIYAEGFFVTDYETQYAGTIAADFGTLTLGKIRDNNNHLRFALDSLVTAKAGYGAAYPYLQHQLYPKFVSTAEDLLYPRNAVATWFDGVASKFEFEGGSNDYDANPYLTVYNREYTSNKVDKDIAMSDEVKKKIMNPDSSVTDYVPVNKSMSLTVRLRVLSSTTGDTKPTSDVGEDATFQNDDTAYEPVTITSENMSPYFYALNGNAYSVSISSMRDFNNLNYVFNDSDSSITTAKLAHDISGQEFYEKLVSVRYAAIGKIKTVSGNDAAKTFSIDVWNSANADNIGVNAMNITNRTGKTFTIDGEKPKGGNSKGGNYAISNVEGGGRATYNGGFFGYAENVVFSNIDIVNPRGWRNHYNKGFLSRQEDGKLNNIALEWQSVVSGSLVGLAVNCQFDNVHAYIDPSKLLQVEQIDGGINGDPREKDPKNGNRIPQGMGDRRIAGTVVGGLVGMAIGDGNGQTTFNNCAASTLLTTEYLFAPSQCVYAGGLVGIAYGGVSIVDCYAACALNGYYSGGLVGATASGTWSYNNNGIYKSGTAAGALTMTNSFAAGHIDRLVRVGGGLIACVDDGTKLNVGGCYSAVQWDALPPVAYGTFPGDDSTLEGAAVRTNKNYYIAQTDLFFPLTLNVEAHFNVTSGDVFSLQGNNRSGIPCTADQLIQAFVTNGDWVVGNAETPISTARWRYTESDANSFSDDEKKEKYPFPMPNGNNNFWGDWINTGCYNTTGEIATTTPSVVFDRYICPNYVFLLSWGAFQRHVNVGALKTKDIYLNLYVDKDPTNSLAALLNGNTIGPDTKYGYWATESMTNDGALNYGQGISGATTVVLDKEKQNFVLYGPKFYDPGYNPITGYNFKPVVEGINSKVSQLNWDYYGFYFTGINNSDDPYTNDATTKYYIQFDEKVNGTNAIAEKAENGGDVGNFLHVNEQTFKDVVKYYDNLTLPTDLSQLQLIWITNSDGSGYFRVQPNGMGA